MEKSLLKHIGVLLCAILYGLFINEYYRISSPIKHDFFSDVGNNLCFVPATYSALYLMRRRYYFSKKGDVVFHFCSLSLIEALSYFFPLLGVFDAQDILGLFIGAAITYLIFK